MSAGGATYLIPASFWNAIGLSAENPVAHLLFEGAGEGRGQLVVTAHHADGTEISETAGPWLDLKNIKRMYERARAFSKPADIPYPYTFHGPDDNNIPNLSMFWLPDPLGYPLQADPQEAKTYIVFVHGWSQTADRAFMYGETMFKRLWHVGYKGRFAVFTWPTYTSLASFNDSEYRAWKCGDSLRQYLNSLPQGYTRNLAAHSMGNVVAGEALRLGATVANYAMLNAAVPAMCYDPNPALEQWNYTTPNDDPDLGTRALAYINRFANHQFCPNTRPGDNVRLGARQCSKARGGNRIRLPLHTFSSTRRAIARQLYHRSWTPSYRSTRVDGLRLPILDANGRR